jgi:hypothetical protein
MNIEYLMLKPIVCDLSLKFATVLVTHHLILWRYFSQELYTYTPPCVNISVSKYGLSRTVLVIFLCNNNKVLTLAKHNENCDHSLPYYCYRFTPHAVSILEVTIFVLVEMSKHYWRVKFLVLENRCQCTVLLLKFFTFIPCKEIYLSV